VGQAASQERQKQLLEKILKTRIIDLLKEKEWARLHEKLFEILPRDINVASLIQKLQEE